ncbi:hypothetical protein A2U01_0060959, partial [Trifolium medium]|nr:hypothetical protein [Trifolium medium]
MSSLMEKELELIEEFRDLSLVCHRTTRSVKFKTLIEQGKKVDVEIDDHGVMRCRGWVCVPDVPELKKMILEEGHRS